MAYAKTKFGTAVVAVRDRLRTALTADAGQCYLSLSDESPDHEGGVVYRVKPGPCDLSVQHWDGGGREQTTYDSTVEVQIWTRVELDEHDHDDARLTDAALGIYAEVHSVLSALNAHELLNTGGDSILREPVQPTSIGDPVPVGDWVLVSLRFGLMFDWDFS